MLLCFYVTYRLIPELIGGLGDVAGSLPKALARRGHRVMVTCYSFNELTEYHYHIFGKRTCSLDILLT